jgi:serine/threonine protein kinase
VESADVEGIKLGRYRVLKHLASGGMADLLLARAGGIEGFARHVVIKRIRAEQAKDPRYVKMFLDEARLAATLHHQNIAQVHDIGEQNGEYFFAMEYVHGEDMRRFLLHLARAKVKTPLEHVVTIVTGACAGLHQAHEQRGPDRKPLGLVHRDISPGNILVGYDGSVKVVDFGIAKVSSLSSQSSGDTRSGVLKGKVAYMAPEQCTGEILDRRADVYSLGVVLYEAATVRRLFKGDNDYLTMSAIVEGRFPRPSALRPDLPPALEDIIMKALSKDRAERYQTAEELRLALEAFAKAESLHGSPSSLSDFMTAQFGRRPEPWLVDEDVLEVEVGIDFDGSASGVAAASTGVRDDLAIPQGIVATPSSPIGVARHQALSAVVTDPRSMSDDDDFVRAARRPSARRWLYAAGAAAVVAVVVVIAVATSGGGGDADAADAKAAVAVPAAPALPVVAPVAPVVAPPPPVTTATTLPAIPVPPPTSPVTTPTTPTAPTTAVAPAAQPVKKKPPAAPVKWDPHKLFPK